MERSSTASLSSRLTLSSRRVELFSAGKTAPQPLHPALCGGLPQAHAAVYAARDPAPAYHQGAPPALPAVAHHRDVVTCLNAGPPHRRRRASAHAQRRPGVGAHTVAAVPAAKGEVGVGTTDRLRRPPVDSRLSKAPRLSALDTAQLG